MAAALLTVVVRWLHVLAMALVLGGAVAVWVTLRVDPPRSGPDSLAIAAAYERLFWLAAGILVATGVGNLGAMAPAVPTVGPWAATFAVKLLAVLALLVLSVGRTLGLQRAVTGPRQAATIRPLRYGYAATALLLVGILALAEVLAHG